MNNLELTNLEEQTLELERMANALEGINDKLEFLLKVGNLIIKNINKVRESK